MSSILVRHVNFLEQKKHGPQETFSLNYLWIIVIIAVFAIGAVGFSFVQKKRIAAMQGQLDSTAAEVAKIKSAQSQKEAQTQSEKAIKDVLNEPIIWSKLLKKITRNIPEAIKLNQVSGSITDKRTLVVKGETSFLLPIFRLKDLLSNVKECSKTALISVEQAEGDKGQEQISFHLECTLL